MHPLDGIRIKFIRACNHLKALDDAVQRFNETDTCTVIPELNEQTGKCTLRVKILKSPPIEWAVIIGEIAYDLRSCLDHMAWQLALKQVTTPFNKTEFPIFITDTLYNRDGLRKIRDLSDSHRAFIERLQPYHARNPHEHPLWLLHELNNTDKHRLLPLSNVAVYYGPDPNGMLGIYFTGGDFSKKQMTQLELTLHTKVGKPMDNNAKIATFKVVNWGLQKQVQVQAKLTSSIIFDKGIGDNSGRRVDETLKSIFSSVQDIIDNCTNHFFP
jgi:hypothetical protein